jgi:hypothetical protein
MGRGTRVGLAFATTLLLFPLLAVPLYLIGQSVADAADNDDSNGVFALGLFLGVGGPGLLTILVAYRTLRFPAVAAVVLGVITGMAAVVVLFAALVIACGDCDL